VTAHPRSVTRRKARKPYNPRGRKRRNTIKVPTPENATPNQLRFYDQLIHWKNVILNAKIFYIIFLCCRNAFPKTGDALVEARNALHEARSEALLVNVQLEPGSSVFFVLLHLLIRMTIRYFHRQRDV
jgi:hypothetical protein